MPDNFDPTTITDPTLRQVVQALMNQVETLHEQTRTQAAEIQRLRDEIARLKGEQGKPDIKPNRPRDADRSSEDERKPPRTPRGKRARNQELTVTREEVVRCDPATLPEDAQFKGYQPVIAQDVLLSSEVIRFQKEKYYSPGLHRLADRIAEQAGEVALGASWPERAPRPAWQPVRVQSWQR